MRTWIFIILTVLISKTGFCTNIDTTIFDSGFEKKLFFRIADSADIEPIDYFISLGYSDNYLSFKTTLNDFVTKLKSKYTNQEGTKRQLKDIYKTVHSEFLKKYDSDKYFSDIFSTGEYNCVTASALYALILDRLKIDYIIKQTPDHVYIIADPENSDFLIETTKPIGGLIQFDDKFKKNYVDYLHDNKLVSDQEFRTQSIDDLFSAYYTTDKTIDIKNLAGIHYYNKAISQLSEKKYLLASRNFEKAEMLYSSEIISFMMNIAIANVLNDESTLKIYNGKTLAKYLNCNQQNGILLQYGKDYFKDISDEMIINHPNIEKYNSYFDDLNLYLSDSIQRDDFYQTYYSSVGYYYFCKSNYLTSLSNLEKTFVINPDNMRTKLLISESAIKYLIVDNNFESRIDSIELYFKKFPFLIETESLQRFLTYCYSKIISSCYSVGNANKGYKFLSNFESFASNNPAIALDPDLTGTIYCAISAYYVRNNKYSTAVDYLEKGLKLTPNSYEIKHSLNTIENERGVLFDKNGSESNKSGNPNTKIILSRTNANKSRINETIDSYLFCTWFTDKMIDKGELIEMPVRERINLTFFKNHEVVFHHEAEESNGYWNYDNSTCTINIMVNGNSTTIHFRISEINSLKMKALIYYNHDYDGSKEVLLKSVRE
jgi:tetratricopeptide (TPR) repeat protein